MGPPGAHMGGLYGNDLRDGIARDAVHGNRGYRRAAAPFVGAALRGDSREEALRAAHKVSAASRVGVCQRGFARFVATVSEITRDGEGFTEHMDTVHTVDPLDRMPELRTLAREAAANRADGKIIRHIAGHTEAIDTAKRAGDYYSLYRVEGSAFGDFSCYRVGHAPYNGTLYLPAGFHDYGIATVDELFVALVVGRCEFLCEYQDEIDEVYHGLFEKRI